MSIIPDQEHLHQREHENDCRVDGVGDAFLLRHGNC